tara:strand:- start:2323 stop:3441 length:1119 start_codon:yes stop_codon:yes gene_type:complete
MAFSFIGLNEALDDIAEDKEKAIALKELQEEKERQRERQDKSDDLQERSFGLRVSEAARVAKAAETAEELARRKMIRDEADLFFKTYGSYAGTSSSGTGKLSSKLSIDKSSYQYLKGLGFSQEFLIKVQTADKTGLTKIKNSVVDRLKTQKKSSRSTTLSPNIIGQIETDTLIIDPETKDFDFNNFFEKFKGVYSETEQEIMRRSAIEEGSVYTPEEIFVAKEIPTLENLERFEKRIVSDNEVRAKNELLKISGTLATLLKTSDSTSMSLKSWLTERRQKITEALEDYKRGSWVTTASLYGTDSTALYEMYPKFKNSSLLPSITNAKKDLLTVDNRAMAIRLYELGFLQAGDKVVDLSESTSTIKSIIPFTP